MDVFICILHERSHYSKCSSSKSDNCISVNASDRPDFDFFI